MIMIKHFKYSVALLFILFMTGCVVAPSDKSVANKNEVEELKFEEATQKSALRLERSGKYMEAYKQYNILADSAVSRKELYRYMRGKSRCLSALGKPKLALAALAPLPVKPTSPLDCLQLALAGKLLLQLKKYEEAEAALEVALDGVRGKEQKHAKWTAAASANLGNAYFHNGKPYQAKIMFQKAGKLFHRLSNSAAERKCLKMILALEQLRSA